MSHSSGSLSPGDLCFTHRTPIFPFSPIIISYLLLEMSTTDLKGLTGSIPLPRVQIAARDTFPPPSLPHESQSHHNLAFYSTTAAWIHLKPGCYIAWNIKKRITTFVGTGIERERLRKGFPRGPNSIHRV
jgi:hypothetical protein